MHVISALVDDHVESLADLLGLFSREALWDLAVVVKESFFKRRECVEVATDLFGESFGVGFFDPREDSPQRRKLCDVRCDRFGDAALCELFVVNGLFSRVLQEIRNAKQFDAAFERGELGDLFKLIEILFVCVADQEEVKEEDDGGDVHMTRFTSPE